MKTKQSRAGATRSALIRAAIELLDRRSAADISVKDIAGRAGVNHGLVHRYFGSKEGLFREAFRRTHEDVRRTYPETGQAVFTVSLLEARPEIARILARCCLDGPRDLLELAAPAPAQLEVYVRPIRRALERAGLARALDPYVVNAAACAMLFGWIVFRPLFRTRGYGLPPDADERFAAIAALLDAVQEAEGYQARATRQAEPIRPKRRRSRTP